jgi:hypothetical protein
LARIQAFCDGAQVGEVMGTQAADEATGGWDGKTLIHKRFWFGLFRGGILTSFF